MKEIYEKLGKAKCRELSMKSESLWTMQTLSKSRKNAPVTGRVAEGIAKDFIREFLPAEFGLKSGLIFDPEVNENKRMSPQIDAIIYRGAPLLEFTDVAVVEKQQVKAIIEVKSWIDTTAIFGDLKKGVKDRDLTTGLVSDFKRKKEFMPAGANYILFAFELYSGADDDKVLERLKKICDMYAVVSRKKGQADDFDFDNSVSKLIGLLRNLS
ncbi:hypothetical protein ES703_04805 [subsurface metagenome]